MTLRLTILGCGSSGGVPRLSDAPGGAWGDCDPADPRNRRTRCSLLVERDGPDGTTRVLVDTSPDMRAQLLAAGIGRLDGIVWTHGHADHTNGIDDIRMIVFNARERVRGWAHPPTAAILRERFAYVFEQEEGSSYPAICDLTVFDAPFEVPGPGGPVPFAPIEVAHGAMPTLGLRIGRAAYVPDAVTIPEASWPLLGGLDLWIVDALRRRPHPTHAHLDRTLEWIDRARPARAVLTNMHVDLDRATVEAETPAHITPAHDGMTLTAEL